MTNNKLARKYNKARRTRLEKLMGRLQIATLMLLLLIAKSLCDAVVNGNYEKAESPLYPVSIAVLVVIVLPALQIIKMIPKTRRGLWKIMHRMPDEYRKERYIRKNGGQNVQKTPIQNINTDRAIIDIDGTEIPY